MRGETAVRAKSKPGPKDFNPLSPCGERLTAVGNMSAMILFQSTLPMRGETIILDWLGGDDGDFNPLSPCGERRRGKLYHTLPEHISIHSPHAGRDRCCTGSSARNAHFNPLSPCGERHSWRQPLTRTAIFQSTLPMRGETDLWKTKRKTPEISIHSPHAGRDPPIPAKQLS